MSTTKKHDHDANSILINAFHAWDGIHEVEETRAAMIVSCADELEIVGDALEAQVPSIEVAVRVVRRASERLRLSLEIEPEQVRQMPSDAELNAMGWIRAADARSAFRKLIVDVPLDLVTEIDNEKPESEEDERTSEVRPVGAAC